MDTSFGLKILFLQRFIFSNNPCATNYHSRAQKRLSDRSIIQWGCRIALLRREEYVRLHLFRLLSRAFSENDKNYFFVNDIYLFGRKKQNNCLLEILFFKIFIRMLQVLAPPVAIIRHWSLFTSRICENFQKIISRKDGFL